MGEQPMSGEAEWPELLEREAMKVQMDFIQAAARLAKKWPNYRKEIATGLLGGAIAFVDSMGGDAEGCLRRIRQNCHRPPIFSPPKGS